MAYISNLSNHLSPQFLLTFQLFRGSSYSKKSQVWKYHGHSSEEHSFKSICLKWAQNISKWHKKGFRHFTTQQLLKLDFVLPKQVGKKYFTKPSYTEVALANASLKEVKSNNSEMWTSRINKNIYFINRMSHSKEEFNTC